MPAMLISEEGLNISRHRYPSPLTYPAIIVVGLGSKEFLDRADEYNIGDDVEQVGRER